MKRGLYNDMKRLGIHQTYFFPYIGYFTVLNKADIFVHADSLQYEERSWINRNRIIGETLEPKYITVPLRKNNREAAINERLINYDKEWEKEILNQFGYYKKRAPYYREVMDMLGELFSQKYQDMSKLAIRSTELVLERLNIKKEIHLLSEIDIGPTENLRTDDWGIAACKAFNGVDTYVNAPGGKSFYNPDKYTEAGLGIEFIQNRLRPYDQKNNEFIPALSILDVMMFNSSEDIKEMLDDYYVL